MTKQEKRPRRQLSPDFLLLLFKILSFQWRRGEQIASSIIENADSGNVLHGSGPLSSSFPTPDYVEPGRVHHTNARAGRRAVDKDYDG